MNWIRTVVINWLKHKRPLPSTPLSDFERIRHEIKPCDLLLVEGRSRISDVIKMVTQSNWSHAMLYIGRLHDIEDAALRERLCSFYHGSADKQLIIESELGTGTVVRPLAAYAGEHIRICRPRGLGFSDSQKVIAYAIRRLGASYNVRQVFDLGRFLLPWAFLPRRWRSTLFNARPGVNTQTVCSTMIAEAFGSIQFPILPLVRRVDGDRVQLFMRNPLLCTPKDFDYSPYFDIIKYPFLDFHQYADQRLYPWQGSTNIASQDKDLYVTAEPSETGLPDEIR